MWYRGSLATRAGVVAAALTLATILRVLFLGPLGTSFPYLTYFVAILIAAATYGWRAGIAASALGGILGTALFAGGNASVMLAVRYVLLSIGTVACVEFYRRVQARDREKQHEETRFSWISATLANLPDPVLVTDSRGRIALLNPAAENLLGWKADEAIGVPVDEVALFDESGLLRRRDGIEYELEVNRVPLNSVPGGGLLYSIRDITSEKSTQRALAQSEGRLRLALSAARMGAWTNEVRSGRVIWSQELEDIAGIPRGSFEGTEDAFYRIIHPDDRQSVQQEVARAVAEQREYEIEFRFYRASGEMRWMKGRGQAFYDDAGLLVRVAGIAEDITERKHLLEALQIQANELKRSNHDLEQFAYIASHDLQEPLRTIGLYSQLLNDRFRGQVDLAADQYIDFIVGSVRRMQAQIKGLLAYSMAGRRRDSWPSVSASAALEAALENLRALLTESGASVQSEDLPTIEADEQELILLFQNLISNAVRFRSRQPPEIRVRAERLDGKQWMFSVRDNGIGIDPRYSQRIFDIFKRLHGREVEGTGIGLAVCKRVAEGMGGRIWVESSAGQGADFRFTVPVREGEHRVSATHV